MPDGPYPIFEVRPEWVLEAEALGSKEKFWYRADQIAVEWLFKYPQPNTGQHWSEKIAAELAACLDIPHARVELAVFSGHPRVGHGVVHTAWPESVSRESNPCRTGFGLQPRETVQADGPHVGEYLSGAG
ncbi:MAG: hypothetical protein NW703_15050 [Nitrospiraceae bacterium]